MGRQRQVQHQAWDKGPWRVVWFERHCFADAHHHVTTHCPDALRTTPFSIAVTSEKRRSLLHNCSHTYTYTYTPQPNHNHNHNYDLRLCWRLAGRACSLAGGLHCFIGRSLPQGKCRLWCTTAAATQRAGTKGTAAAGTHERGGVRERLHCTHFRLRATSHHMCPYVTTTTTLLHRWQLAC